MLTTICQKGCIFSSPEEKDMHKTKFVCSDGAYFFNAKKANIHEMYIRIRMLFPDISFIETRQYKGKEYFLGKHLSLKRGVYRVEINDFDDLETLNFFFKGLDMTLGFPEEDELPMEVCIDIYYEKIPNVILQHAQWRIYKDENYLK